jgi:hypothetical protein
MAGSRVMTMTIPAMTTLAIAMGKSDRGDLRPIEMSEHLLSYKSN